MNFRDLRPEELPAAARVPVHVCPNGKRARPGWTHPRACGSGPAVAKLRSVDPSLVDAFEEFLLDYSAPR